MRTGPFSECATIRRLLEVADYETANVARRRHPVRSGLNHARRGRTARDPLEELFEGFAWALGNDLNGAVRLIADPSVYSEASRLLYGELPKADSLYAPLYANFEALD